MRFDAFHTALARQHAPGAQYQISAHRFDFTLDLHRLERLQIKSALNVAEGILGNQHTAHRCGFLQPACQVDGIANGSKFMGGGDFAQQHRPGVQPDAHSDGHLAQGHAFLAKFIQCSLQFQGGLGGLSRVVLACFVHPPQSHDLIADMFVYPTAAFDDAGIQALPQGIDQVGNILGIHLLGQGGETRNIGKQYADQLALLFIGGLCLGAQCGQLFTQRRQGGFHQLISQYRTLRIQSLDGSFNLLDLFFNIFHFPGNHRDVIDYVSMDAANYIPSGKDTVKQFKVALFLTAEKGALCYNRNIRIIRGFLS